MLLKYSQLGAIFTINHEIATGQRDRIVLHAFKQSIVMAPTQIRLSL